MKRRRLSFLPLLAMSATRLCYCEDFLHPRYSFVLHVGLFHLSHGEHNHRVRLPSVFAALIHLSDAFSLCMTHSSRHSKKGLTQTSSTMGAKRQGSKTAIRNNVVSRLAKAAKEAAATADKKKNREGTGTGRNGTDVTETVGENASEKLPFITSLNKVIDEELLHPQDGYKPALETDSVRALLEHNNKQNDTKTKCVFSSKRTFERCR